MHLKLLGRFSAKDLTVGGVTFAGSLIPGGGVIAGPLLGAAVGTIWSLTEGESPADAFQEGILDGVMGALPGGKMAGGALKGLAARGAGQGAAHTLLHKGERAAAKRAVGETWGLIGTRAAGRGAGAAVASAFQNGRLSPSSSPAGISELPIKIIS